MATKNDVKVLKEVLAAGGWQSGHRGANRDRATARAVNSLWKRGLLEVTSMHWSDDPRFTTPVFFVTANGCRTVNEARK